MSDSLYDLETDVDLVVPSSGKHFRALCREVTRLRWDLPGARTWHASPASETKGGMRGSCLDSMLRENFGAAI